ncbi:BURP domain-containing protein 11-like isoform X4 [Malus domestica]|uniref:BURP domain-containing protein 11-like isoform X4 n=1 Tax=Malus domestica TaxID=3750 RepID=UPI0010AAAD0E|nr:BURP domain-containing protein 11-like isoform X3 [Malus domestica]
MASRFIIFCLLFVLQCRYATGARDVVKQQYKIGYGATKSMKEVEDSPNYITNCGNKQGRKGIGATKSMKEVEDLPNYITNYGNKQGIIGNGATKSMKEVEDLPNYITNYGNKQGRKGIGATKSMKEVEDIPNYITNYGGRKGAMTPYTMSYATKEEVETPYTMSYATKEEVQTPYTMNYATKESKKEVKTPYTMSYAAKEEVETPYKMSYGTEEVEPSHEHVHIHMHPQSQPHMDHNEASKQGFFTFDDLHCGMRMPLHFPNQEHSRFLPKEVADSIPFSTPHIPQIRQLFSIPQGSQEAKNVAYALEQCEMKPITGETKFCATSLESMTNFVTKIIGSGVRFNILSTEHPTTSTSITQRYTILEEPKQVLASKMVFCHPLAYPYAVFFCHHFERDTKFFKVKLGGENGDKVQAVAVCHMDTSDWDPAHDLFALLGIKASASSPVCHFLPENHLVWIPSPATSAI